jgi:flagellar biosynthesis chaperone FliJ
LAAQGGGSSKEFGLYPNRNSESHRNKWKHTQTFLDTLGTKLERLGSKAEANTKEHEQSKKKAVTYRVNRHK